MASNCSQNQTAPASTSLVYASLYSLVFVAGLVLNSTALWVFFQIRAQKRTFMLYLRNMVAADLLMTLTLPFTVLSESGVGRAWLPAFTCKYTAVLFYSSMYANILFLALVALDRYLKIVRPFGGKCGACLYSYSFTRAIAVMVWLVMGALSLPNIILTNKPVTPAIALSCSCLKSTLGMKWHEAVVYINIGIFYVALVTLLICYVSIYRHIHHSSAQFVSAQRENKSGQNILVLVVVFFVCFVPYHLWRIPFTQSQINFSFSPEVKQMLTTGKRATIFLSSCNVCLDPIIYFLMCRSFRSKLAQTMGLKAHMHKVCSPTTVRKETQVLRFKEYSSSS